MKDSLIGFSLAIATFLILFTSVTFAENIFRTEDKQGNSLVLLQKECTLLPLKKWKEAILVFKGKTYKACWTASDGIVTVLDSDEDITYLPVENFVKENQV